MSKGLLEEFNFKFPCNAILRSLPGQSDILRFAMHVFKLYDYSGEPNTVQKVKHETADLVTFTEETLNGKLHFLCSETFQIRPK